MCQSAELAIACGFEQGAFKAIQHARNAYEKMKREHQPKTAEEMAGLWIGAVRSRKVTGEPNDDAADYAEIGERKLL